MKLKKQVFFQHFQAGAAFGELFYGVCKMSLAFWFDQKKNGRLVLELGLNDFSIMQRKKIMDFTRQTVIKNYFKLILQ